MFLTEVNGTDDLNNAADVGMQTSVRIRCDWKVHVAEGQPAPPRPTDGHAFVPLARIIRQKDDPVIRTEMLSDVRQRRLSVADLEQRMSVVEALRLQPSFADPGFSPSNGIAGQQITLNGRNFDVKDLAVDFGGAKARILDSSPASAVVEVPQGLTPNGSATGVTISVSSLGGTATTSRAFTVRATPQFGDIGQQIQPPKAAIGSDVTLLGHNFKGSGLAVTLGDQSADVVGKPDNTALVVKVPSGLQIGAEVAAKVQTDEGTVLSQDKIKIIPPAPTLEANPFVPSTQSRGQTFKIKGKNLISPMTVIFVKFNREVDGDPLPEGNTAIVKVPDDLTETGATKIDVKTAGGSVRSAIDFTVQS
jgi:hypothetical protein